MKTEVEPMHRAAQRRIALAKQGLLQNQHFGRGRPAVLKAIRHLGYLQIDTISVVARAHNHALRSRIANFQPAHLDRLLLDRQIFEYRFPVAAFRPIEDFRFSLPHMRIARSRKRSRSDSAVMKHVVDRIRAEGPLRSRDFEDPRSSKSGWWDWKPAKRALETLYYQGDLMISARTGVEKSYDLTERVLPASIDTTEPTPAEFANHLIDSALRAHGFATYKTFTYDGRKVPLDRTVRTELDRRTAGGELVRIDSDGRAPWWVAPETLAARTPPAPKRAQILSPFDGLVIQRDRAFEVFDFDYRIECYVPESDRRFGYFCLPIVHSDQLVGRMDCKAHRDASRFEVKALYLEPEAAGRDRAAEITEALAVAIVAYAGFNECEEVTVSRTKPAFAKRLLGEALRRVG